jgi:hypothetical protein
VSVFSSDTREPKLSWSLMMEQWVDLTMEQTASVRPGLERQQPGERYFLPDRFVRNVSSVF